MKIYYAHPMSWYNTPEEAADVAFLTAKYPDAEIINPNSPMFEEKVKKAKKSGWPIMQIFADYIAQEADVVVFRRFHPTDYFQWPGPIGSGVGREIFEAKVWGKKVWEIRNHYQSNGLEMHEDVRFDCSDYECDVEVTFNEILTVAETRQRIIDGTL